VSENWVNVHERSFWSRYQALLPSLTHRSQGRYCKEVSFPLCGCLLSVWTDFSVTGSATRAYRQVWCLFDFITKTNTWNIYQIRDIGTSPPCFIVVLSTIFEVFMVSCLVVAFLFQVMAHSLVLVPCQRTGTTYKPIASRTFMSEKTRQKWKCICFM